MMDKEFIQELKNANIGFGTFIHLFACWTNLSLEERKNVVKLKEKSND